MGLRTLVAVAATTLGFIPVTMGQIPIPNPIPTRIPIIQPPLVVWHGLGDSSDSEGIQKLIKLVETVHPGTYVHVVHLDESEESSTLFGEEINESPILNDAISILTEPTTIFANSGQDTRASLFGNVTDQVQVVCRQLEADPILNRMSKVNGLGFSQGGLFLRALIQECDWFADRIHSLVSMGSPHNGVANLQICKPRDFACKKAVQFFKSRIWSDWVQSHVVPAQYYRPVVKVKDEKEDGEVRPVPEYLEHSSFLTHLNNEKEACYHDSNGESADSDVPSQTSKKGCTTDPIFASRLSRSLQNLGLFAFLNDTVLVPPVSAWWASTFESSPESPFLPVDTEPLHLRRFWTEDWIGLRSWAERVSERSGVPIRGRWNDAVPTLIGGKDDPILKDESKTKENSHTESGVSEGGDHISATGIFDLLPIPSTPLPAIVFGALEGQHMQIEETNMRQIAGRFFGPLSTLKGIMTDEQLEKNHKLEL